MLIIQLKKVDFPLKDVNISFTKVKPAIYNPLFTNDFMQVSSSEILIDIGNVASYYIVDGNSIQIYPYSGSNEFDIQDQLEKWGVISILHQRKILNFHASSFSLEGTGTMICGDTSAGKSSVTAAFSFGRGKFLNDDITAIHFRDNKAMIEKLGHGISLLPEAVQQLGLNSNEKVPDGYKQNLTPSNDANEFTPLGYIIHLSIINSDRPVINEIHGPEKFRLLRSNICNWEMLAGMPGLEAEYMKQLLAICDATPVYSLERPKTISVKDIAKIMEPHLTPNT